MKINDFIIPTMLNKLPEDLQKIQKIGEAKRKIKKHLMSLIQQKGRKPQTRKDQSE